MKQERTHLEELSTLGGVTWREGEISDPVGFFFGFFDEGSFSTLGLAHFEDRQGAEHIESSHVE